MGKFKSEKPCPKCHFFFEYDDEDFASPPIVCEECEGSEAEDEE